MYTVPFHILIDVSDHYIELYNITSTAKPSKPGTCNSTCASMD